MTTSAQLLDLIAVLSSESLTAEEQVKLDELREAAEALRVAESVALGDKTATVAVDTLRWTGNAVGFVGSRGSSFLNGFFNALRK